MSDELRYGTACPPRPIENVAPNCWVGRFEVSEPTCKHAGEVAVEAPRGEGRRRGAAGQGGRPSEHSYLPRTRGGAAACTLEITPPPDPPPPHADQTQTPHPSAQSTTQHT